MRWWACFLFLLAATGALFPAPAAEPLNKIAAVVNGEIITSYDLAAAAAPELLRERLDSKNPAHASRIRTIQDRVLEAMINDIIMAQEAERMKVGVDESEVETALQQFKERSRLDDNEFQRQLRIQGLSEDDFRRRIRKGLLRNRLLATMVGRKVVVTKEEIASYYEQHKHTLQADGRVRVALIVYPPDASAETWAQRISSGRIAFDEAVRKVSVGPRISEGGNLGEIDQQDLAPELREQLEKLSPGQVSGLFVLNNLQTQIKLLSRSAGVPQSLEEASEEIERILREPKLEERYREYSAQLRKRAVVDIRS